MMKKYYLLLALAIPAVCMWGCKDDEESAPDSVYMYSTSATVGAVPGEKSVTIFTTCPWTVSGDTWITVSPGQGGEKGIHVVKLSYTANSSGVVRTGTVTFTAGTYTQTYTLSQKSD